MKKIKKYGFILLIIIVGVLDLLYGINTWYSKEKFIKNAKTTTGHIYMISNHKKTRVLYLYYEVKNKKYDNLLVVRNQKIKISDQIKIYYDIKNPTKISSKEKNHIEFVIIILGSFFILLGIILICRNYQKEIEKKHDL